MFTLVAEKNKFFKVKRGQSAGDIQSELKVPVCGEAFAGRIIRTDAQYVVHIARPLESYASLAESYGVSEREIREVNGDKPVYPTCSIFIPR